MVAKLDEAARYNGVEYPLSTNRWVSGMVEPKGYLNIESFQLDGTTPVWRFVIGDALLEKRIWMQQGENTTFVQYSLIRASNALELECKTLVNYRDYHSTTHAGNWQMQVENVASKSRRSTKQPPSIFPAAMPPSKRGTTGTATSFCRWNNIAASTPAKTTSLPGFFGSSFSRDRRQRSFCRQTRTLNSMGRKVSPSAHAWRTPFLRIGRTRTSWPRPHRVGSNSWC